MTDITLTGGTVVTAEGSFAADVAIRGGRIAEVGDDLRPQNGGETVDVTGRLLMPGFIDGHTHMDMPFGGTITADDWDTGTAAALAGGTTMIVDFTLQQVGDSLADAIDTWHGKAEGKTHIDYGRARTRTGCERTSRRRAGIQASRCCHPPAPRCGPQARARGRPLRRAARR